MCVHFSVFCSLTPVCSDSRGLTLVGPLPTCLANAGFSVVLDEGKGVNQAHNEHKVGSPSVEDLQCFMRSACKPRHRVPLRSQSSVDQREIKVRQIEFKLFIAGKLRLTAKLAAEPGPSIRRA